MKTVTLKAQFNGNTCSERCIFLGFTKKCRLFQRELRSVHRHGGTWDTYRCVECTEALGG